VLSSSPLDPIVVVTDPIVSDELKSPNQRLLYLPYVRPPECSEVHFGDRTIAMMTFRSLELAPWMSALFIRHCHPQKFTADSTAIPLTGTPIFVRYCPKGDNMKPSHIIKRVGIEDLRRILRQQPKLARLRNWRLNATSSVPPCRRG